MPCHPGIDNGGTKAVLFDISGVLVGAASRSRGAINLAPGVVERDMEEMWRGNCLVIRELIASPGINSADIAGIACRIHAKGLYPWRKNDRPVRNGILSSDNRAWAYLRQWKADGTERKVFERSAQPILSCQPVALLA
jgi:L-xylulokinase